MKKYYFIYLESDVWSVSKNPEFIARHPHCRAIRKSKLNGRSIKFIVRKLNRPSTSIRVYNYLCKKYSL